ncbi:MAG: ABC transporter ATP-binding protein, partial [Defluviitaleaceae bacterium]|nr:ABC transporter ATP-binding protein [Defluviitaleaceae bacterium]MCL2263474.1 ABC transporter ATP-binding protein [Defluviitaleaceae bacterium]
MRAAKWFLPYVTRYKWRLIFGLLVNTVNVGLMLVNPLFAGLIVQNVIQGGQYELLPRYLTIMIVITVYRSVSRYLFAMMFEHTSQKILFNLRRDVYHKLHTQSFSWFDKNRVGDIMSRMTGDLDAIRHFVAFVIYMVIEHIQLYIAAVIIMATISLPLTFAMLITTPVVIFAALKQSSGVRPAFRNVREQFANLNSMCGENISGNRVVKAFTQESHETEKFQQVNKDFFDANMAAAAVRIKYFPVIETCAALLPWFLLLFGGLLTIHGHLELWQMVAFGGYLWMIDAPTRIFTWAINDIQNAATSIDKVYEMMREKVAIKSSRGEEDFEKSPSPRT